MSLIRPPICVLSPSTVAFVTRMANSHARHARLPRVQAKGAVCLTTCTKARHARLPRVHAKGAVCMTTCTKLGASPLNVARGTEIPRRSTSHKYHAALTLPGRVQRQTHRVHAVVNIQARSGMFPSPGVGGREGRREREVRQHGESTYRHVVYDVAIKRCNI